MSIPVPDGRKLFTSAALFNWGAAVMLAGSSLRPGWIHLVGLDPATGSASLFSQFGIAAIALFGWAYWQVARDPAGNRPFALLGIIGKLATVALIWGHWVAGNIGWPLAALVVVDLIYAGSFWRWLTVGDAQKSHQR